MRAFALIDLLALLLVVAFFVCVYTPFKAKNRESVFITIDLSNLRQILRASALYSSENNDHLAHPTWGSDLTGPDGWAYLTSNRGREVPGALQSTPGSCVGRDINSRQFTNQLAYFKVGQISRYLPSIETAWCPKDLSTRTSGRLRQLWLDRPLKVTSYCWNGTIGGSVGPKASNLNGRTYKISDFLQTDWQLWEQCDSSGFYFNDAASNPETFGEVFSLRHTGILNWSTLFPLKRELPGGTVIGRFDGSGLFAKWPTAYDLMSKRIPTPNPLLNGPGFR